MVFIRTAPLDYEQHIERGSSPTYTYSSTNIVEKIKLLFCYFLFLATYSNVTLRTKFLRKGHRVISISYSCYRTHTKVMYSGHRQPTGGERTSPVHWRPPVSWRPPVRWRTPVPLAPGRSVWNTVMYLKTLGFPWNSQKNHHRTTN